MLVMQTETKKEMLRHIASALVSVAAKTGSDLTEEKIAGLLEQSLKALQPDDAEKFADLIDHALTDHGLYRRPDVTEVRPQQLECDVVRFQNNKEKWVALVGLLDGYPYDGAKVVKVFQNGTLFFKKPWKVSQNRKVMCTFAAA